MKDFNRVKMLILHRVVYRFIGINTFQIPKVPFLKKKKILPKIHMQSQEILNSQIFLTNENKIEDSKLSHLKTYYTIIITKTVW